MNKVWIKDEALAKFNKGELDVLVVHRNYTKDLSHLDTSIYELKYVGEVCKECGDIVLDGDEVCYFCYSKEQNDQ